VTNKDRRQIATESWQKIVHFNCVNTKIIGQKFTKFVHDVAGLLPFNLLKADLRSSKPLLNAKAKSKDPPANICEHLPNLTGCHSNVLSATAKRILG